MTVGSLLVLTSALALMVPPARSAEPQDRLAITPVTVVDVTGGVLRPLTRPSS